jgi:hypothetical protein
MEQQQKHRPLGITIIAILTIIDGIAYLASGIAAVTVAPFLFGVDINNNNNNNVSPVTGTSTSGSVTIPDTLLVRMSVVTVVAILTLGIAYFVMAYGLWIVKRKRMGLDRNSSIMLYWNCIRISFSCK